MACFILCCPRRKKPSRARSRSMPRNHGCIKKMEPAASGQQEEVIVMSIKDLIPFKQAGKKGLPVKRSDSDPFDALHREINRVFENFTRGFWDLSPFAASAMEQGQ